MKIAILSRDGTLYSCRRLREAAQKRGHQVEILDPLSCYMNVSPVASSIHYKGRQLPHFDAVIPRIGTAITYYGTAALRQFELLGSYPLNESVAITRARELLYITYAGERFKYREFVRQFPSVFLQDLPPEIVDKDIPENFNYEASDETKIKAYERIFEMLEEEPEDEYDTW